MPIHRSADLRAWEQIGHALDRPSQLGIDDMPSSGGIFAPTLRHHAGRFWMITTDLYRRPGLLLVAAEDPAGPSGGIRRSPGLRGDWTEHPTWRKSMDARSEAGSRLTALGTQLLEVHLWLREMLEDLQDGIDDYFGGRGLPPRDLRAHCLSFCTALTRHHTGEDGDAFPAIAEEYPELRKVLSDLRTDHNQLDWLMGNLQRLLESLPEEPDPATAAKVREEVQALSAVMQTHFIYEEKKLISVLNSMDVPEWRENRPGFLLIDDEDGPVAPSR